MSRLTSKASTATDWSLDSIEYLFLDGVSWELYEHLLRVVESSHRRLYLTYDSGELEIMSPLPEHEMAKEVIGDCIKVILEVTETPRISLGSTTFRKRLKKKGLEPDSCFYIKNRALIAGKKRINLLKDPPPDLAVEIDITSRSIARIPIYSALGVPEIWRYDGKKIECLLLEKREYRESEFSRAFPRLRVNDLRQFVRLAEDSGDQTVAVNSCRAWLRKQTWIK